VIKKLTPYIGKYKKFAILAPIAIIGEVLLEIRIPYYMSQIVDVGVKNKDIAFVLQTGGMMILMALLALVCGALASIFGARAGMGFGSEIRKGFLIKFRIFLLETLTNSAPPH
jgi:hypothetical protein